MTTNIGEDIANVIRDGPLKQKRFCWRNIEDVVHLKQDRGQKERQGDERRKIHAAMSIAGLIGVLVPAVKDEWNLAILEKKRQLLCEIFSYFDDVKKRGTVTKSPFMEVQKQTRKDTKFQFAAAHSLKKRKTEALKRVKLLSE